MAGSLPWWWL